MAGHREEQVAAGKARKRVETRWRTVEERREP
jgi:hypothetical protein